MIAGHDGPPVPAELLEHDPPSRRADHDRQGIDRQDLARTPAMRLAIPAELPDLELNGSQSDDRVLERRKDQRPRLVGDALAVVPPVQHSLAEVDRVTVVVKNLGALLGTGLSLAA